MDTTTAIGVQCVEIGPTSSEEVPYSVLLFLDGARDIAYGIVFATNEDAAVRTVVELYFPGSEVLSKIVQPVSAKFCVDIFTYVRENDI